MSDENEDTPSFNALLRAKRSDNGAAELARRAIENARRLQAEEDAQVEAEEKARAEADATRGGFNRLLRADQSAAPGPTDPPAPTQPTGAANGGEGTDGTENYVYEDTEFGRMRVFDLD